MMKQLLILFIALGATFANLFEDTTVTPPPVEAGEQHNYHGLFDEENTDDTERIICDSVVAIAFAVHPKDVSSVKQREQQQQQQGLRRAKSEKDGFDDQQDIDEEEVEEYFHKEEEFACQSAEYGLVPITGTDEQMKELRESLANGTLVSTVSTLAVELEDDTEDDANSGGTDAIASAEDEPNTHSKSGKLPAGPVHLLDDTERRLSGGEPHRRLNQYDKLVGTQKLLVLYVKDADGNVPPGSPEYYSDKFFGTDGDNDTPKTQMGGCSHGEFILSNDYGEEMNDKMTAPGVLQVEVKESLAKTSTDTVWKAAVQEAGNILKCHIWSPWKPWQSFGCGFDFIAILLEDCKSKNERCGYAAYAYIGLGISVYLKQYGSFPAVVSHELGHNLRLGHSGYQNLVYADHTCTMGNPHWHEAADKQCYNAAKSYQIAEQGAWYSKEHVKDLDPRKEPYWKGRLIGVAEYDKISDGDTVLLKIETGSSDDYFLAFNRKIGANSDNKMASDQVTIIEAGKSGVDFSQSWLVDWLDEADEYVFKKFLNDEPLTVKVNKIDIQVTPGYAEVEVFLGDARAPETSKPTRAPITSSPTFSSSPTHAPIIEPSMAPSNFPTPVPSVSPSGSPSLPPGKSPTKVYTTAKESKQKAKGLMFQVKADFAKVVVERFSFKQEKDKGKETKVYYQAGPYQNFRSGGLDENEWTEVYSGEPRKTGDEFEVELDTPVTIPAGQTASLYIENENGLLVAKGNNEFERSENAGSFVLNTGVSIKKPWQQKDKPANFAGDITYHTISGGSGEPGPEVTSPPSKSPTSHPTPSLTGGGTPSPTKDASGGGGSGGSGAPKEYTTSNEADEDAKGFMFEVKAGATGVSITELGFMGKKDDSSKVSIYYNRDGGYSLDKGDWTKVFEGEVELTKKEIVNVQLSSEVVINPSQTASVYIYSDRGLMFSTDESEIDAGDFTLMVGMSTKKEFQQFEDNGAFVGALVYQV